MEIRKIQGIIISSLFLAGLSGCSGSSSYTQDDSPWKAKREAEGANVVSEEFVEVSLDEAIEANSMEEAQIEEFTPDLNLDLAEPEMMVQPELESVADFNPEPVVEEMEAVAPAVSSSDIMSASPSAYAVQVYAGRILSNVNRYQSTHGLNSMQIVATDHNGDTVHVLVGIYNNHQSALQAAEDIEASTGSKPWVRSVSGLQRMAVK